ncbi:MAG: hypothetical protein M0035_07120 [Actinomycetota bacterium]|nr:hypothetical protein [Actinomycetota bacterium]
MATVVAFPVERFGLGVMIAAPCADDYGGLATGSARVKTRTSMRYSTQLEEQRSTAHSAHAPIP